LLKNTKTVNYNHKLKHKIPVFAQTATQITDNGMECMDRWMEGFYGILSMQIAEL